MNKYDICTNYLQIIAGTDNTMAASYMEAASNVDKDTTKGMAYLKNFITSIENIASKNGVKDKRISDSKGNIKSFKGYDNIKTALTFMQKNLGAIPMVNECSTILKKLEDNQYLYSKGYEKDVRLVVLEYESAVYILVTTLSMLMANNVDVVSNGTEIKIVKKNANTHGIIEKTAKELSKALDNVDHKTYLEELIKASETADREVGELKENGEFYEANVVTDTLAVLASAGHNIKRIGAAGISAFKKLKKSLFGIVPIIRSCIYLKYKKKADTISSLEQQCAFIQLNIEQLKNRTNMDPEKKEMIIKKQEATIEAYKKKAEKLRAELMETEKEAATEIAKEDPQMKETDGDFVLESGKTFQEIFDTSNDYFIEDYLPDEEYTESEDGTIDERS